MSLTFFNNEIWEWLFLLNIPSWKLQWQRIKGQSSAAFSLYIFIFFLHLCFYSSCVFCSYCTFWQRILTAHFSQIEQTKTAFHNVIITLYVIIICLPSFRLITCLYLYSYNLYMPGSRIYIIIGENFSQLLIHVCLLSLLMTLLVCLFRSHLPVFIHGIS